MAERYYSVIVAPEQWRGSIGELAAALAPFAGLRAAQLEEVLERGEMTLEADLSLEEAGRLKGRLEGLSVPTRVVDASGEEAAWTASLESTPEFAGGAREAADGGEFDGPGWSRLALVADEDAEVRAHEPRERRQTPVGNPWATGPKPSMAEPNAPARFGAEPASGELPPSASSPKPTPKPMRAPSEQTDPVGGLPEAPEQAVPDVARRRSNPRPPKEQTPRRLDVATLDTALEPTAARPPYKPEGFDDRTPHIPLLAGLLSLIAPGAGQVYNGTPERASDYKWRALLLRPWVEGVREAVETARDVASYEAPWPKEGSLASALGYALRWLAVFSAAMAVISLGVSGLMMELSTSEVPEVIVSAADLERARTEAHREVHMARIGGLDGVAAHLDQIEARAERFSMSADERAERLFRRGYASCKARDLSTCESAMKRVSSLSPKFRRQAYSLQAWASMQRRGGADEAMPEVDVGSLEEFELAQHEDAPEAKEASADGGGRDATSEGDASAQEDDSDQERQP